MLCLCELGELLFVCVCAVLQAVDCLGVQLALLRRARFEQRQGLVPAEISSQRTQHRWLTAP